MVAALNPNLNKCVMTKAGTMLMPVGRMSFPNVFKPRAMPGDPPEKAVYSVTLIMPPNSELQPARDWVDKIAVDEWGPKVLEGKLKRPFLRHEELAKDPELGKAFPYMIRCSSKLKPTIVFGNGEACTIEDEVYPGRWARVSMRIYPWEFQTGRGVSFGLSNIMLLDHDERIGGGRAKVEDEFGDYFETGSDGKKGNGASSGKKPDSIFDD